MLTAVKDPTALTWANVLSGPPPLSLTARAVRRQRSGVTNPRSSPACERHQQLLDRSGAHRPRPGGCTPGHRLTSFGGRVRLYGASQIVAGGVGPNIRAASVVVICEPQLKPATEWQAIARAHRIGTNGVSASSPLAFGRRASTSESPRSSPRNGTSSTTSPGSARLRAARPRPSTYPRPTSPET